MLGSSSADELIVNVPPRTLKSTLITIIYPVGLITEPEHRFMAASYGLALSAGTQ
jgi:hypothetical protein